MTDNNHSSWGSLAKASKYHFDKDRIDPQWDEIQHLGKIVPNWAEEVEKIVATSKSVTWGTIPGNTMELNRDVMSNYKIDVGGESIRVLDLSEHYDLTQVNIDPHVTITNINWELPLVLQQVSDCFALEKCMSRIHVQTPGQLWHLHIDKLYRWCPEDPSQVIRINIALTDWEYGQFMEYGNHHFNRWKAGDVTTFDWQNLPHATANAGYHPRITLQLTGIITDQTRKFLNKLKNSNPYSV